jgi:hypothetical protein
VAIRGCRSTRRALRSARGPCPPPRGGGRVLAEDPAVRGGLEWSARHGRRALLPSEASQARIRLAIFRRRILLAPTLYALAALICLISAVASVIALAVVQLYFIASPRLPRRGGLPRPGS